MSEEMQVDNGAGRQKTVRVNYPSNSKRSKEQNEPEKPLIESVITGTVQQRKKPLGTRIASSLVAEDGSTVGQYIITDVLLPALKNMISDGISQGIDRLLFGGDSRPRRTDTRAGYTSYNKVSRPSGYGTSPGLSRQSRANHDFRDIVLETRSDAEDVLERLGDLIDKYGAAKVTDLYDLLGLTGSFTDDLWGWTNLRDARVKPIRGGYLLDLPRTESLEQ